MTKRKYREMVAAIILSVCVSMGAAPIDSLAAGRQITAYGEGQNSQNASGGKDSSKTEGNRGIGEAGSDGSGSEEGGTSGSGSGEGGTSGSGGSEEGGTGGSDGSEEGGSGGSEEGGSGGSEEGGSGGSGGSEEGGTDGSEEGGSGGNGGSEEGGTGGSGGSEEGGTDGNDGSEEGGTGGSRGSEEGGSEEGEGRPSDKEDPDGDENLDNDPDADTNNPPDDENPDSHPNDDQEKPEVNLPDDLVEPDLQNPDLLNPEWILKQDLLVPALYDALPKSNIPELISEDDDGSMIFILNRNGFDIGGYNGEDIIRSSYSGYTTRILMADDRTPSKLGFDGDMKEEIDNLEISLRAEIIPIDGVSYVRLTLYVENTTDDEEIGFSLGIDADTCVGVDDRAKVQSTGDGILMLGRNFGNDGYTDYVNAFAVKDDDESDAPIDRWWYGYYGERTKYIFSGDLPEGDLENLDSGMACSWLDLSLGAGETGQYSVLFGIGDISDYSDVDLSESDYDEGEGAGHDDTEYWSSDGDKWTFSYGNSYSSQWGYLYYNGSYNWYYFDQDGYMVTGWFTAPDGKRFYLNPVSDGRQGAMCTGWNQIDGKWYYFSQEQGSGYGQLLTGTTTPDGYTVNENGEWVQ